MQQLPLPSPGTIPSLSTAGRVAVLDLLFEPCVALHTLSLALLHDSSFASYGDLVASIGAQLSELAESASASDTVWLEKILGAHPRLGDTKVDSEQSRREQAQLHAASAGAGAGAAADQERQAASLAHLNAEYEKTFPGKALLAEAS